MGLYRAPSEKKPKPKPNIRPKGARTPIQSQIRFAFVVTASDSMTYAHLVPLDWRKGKRNVLIISRMRHGDNNITLYIHLYIHLSTPLPIPYPLLSVAPPLRGKLDYVVRLRSCAEKDGPQVVRLETWLRNLAAESRCGIWLRNLAAPPPFTGIVGHCRGLCFAPNYLTRWDWML